MIPLLQQGQFGRFLPSAAGPAEAEVWDAA